MKVELKSVKVNQRMSEETLCFSATIYVDGKKVGEVLNRGCGGCNDYHFDGLRPNQMRDPDGIYQKLDAHAKEWCDKHDPTIKFEHLDCFIMDMVDKIEDKKWFKRRCKSTTLFRLKDTPKDEWRTINRPFDAAIKAHLVEKFGEQLKEIANETRL